MVKKLKYLLFLIPFFTILNVNAENLGAPQTFTYFTDGSEISGTATSIGFWGSENYWLSPTKIGSFTSASPNANSVQFFWNSANLCQNKDISISGTIAALQDFFNEQSYNVRILMNGETLACSFAQENSSRIRYTCYGHGGGHFSIFFNQTSFYGTYRNYDVAVSKSVDLSCDVTNQEIVNQSITNTQNIINNQNSNTNTITQNQDTNTQNIINNQNFNTDKEIESQKVCSDINEEINDTNKDNFTKDRILTVTGNLTSSSNWYVSNYVKLYKDNTYILSGSGLYVSAASYCLYTTNKTLINCFQYNNSSMTYNINTTEDGFIRWSSWQRSSNITSSLTGQYCKNGNQAVSDDLNNLNDTLNDTSQPNTSSDINDMDNMVASDTPISDLITMPLTLVNAYINGINSSCSPVNLGNLLGTDLTLPCINIQEYIGSNLWNIVDILCCIFLCYEIAMLFISAFDGITSLRDDFEDLYQPKHAYNGYISKHGGDK